MRVKEAQLKGFCRLCQEPIEVGQPISPLDQRWYHTECVQFDQNKREVMSGVTYASQRKSDYRRRIRRKD
jgi:hypothetical protein